MKSIMQENRTYCYLCGRNGNGDPLEAHHCIEGARRKLSEKDGLIVYLCGNRCHRNGKESAHMNAETALFLKQRAQEAWEARYGTREDFLQRYGKNYL